VPTFQALGLSDKHARDDQRFQIDRADEPRRFSLSHGVADVDADKVWNAIALHTTPEIPLHRAAEVALVTRGVEHDVLGIGFDTITEEQRAEIVKAHPRPDFKIGRASCRESG